MDKYLSVSKLLQIIKNMFYENISSLPIKTQN